jgi:hypothetical protein
VISLPSKINERELNCSHGRTQVSPRKPGAGTRWALLLTVRAQPGAVKRFRTTFWMAVLHGRAGRLTARSGGSRRGQYRQPDPKRRFRSASRSIPDHWVQRGAHLPPEIHFKYPLVNPRCSRVITAGPPVIAKFIKSLCLPKKELNYGV